VASWHVVTIFSDFIKKNGILVADCRTSIKLEAYVADEKSLT
jgi:hypothetical protein